MLSLLNTTFTNTLRQGFTLIGSLLSKLRARSTYFENQAGTKVILKELDSEGLLEKASIITTPTAYSDGVLHSVKPSESPYADFDFSRASSATRVNKDGLIETVGSNVPRIDYKDDSEGALLLEPERTNLIPYSEDFSQWSLAGGSSISSNQSISPDGTLNADNVSSGEVYVSGVGSSGNTYTFSCYYKGNAGETFIQNVYDGSNHNRFTRTFNGQWQRFSITVTLTNSGIFYLVDDRTGGNSLSFSAWGAQVEQGGYATSYIPTSGSAVTRVADACTNGGNEQVFNDSEGVLMVEISALADDGLTRRLSISDGTTNNRVLIGYSSSNRFQFVVSDGGSVVVNQYITVSNITQFNKVAFKYKLNDCAIWINGQELGTDTTATMPSGLDLLNFDQANGTEDFYGNVKQLQYFDTALTDAELTALTTI
jgi:hypothetical protein